MKKKECKNYVLLRINMEIFYLKHLIGYGAQENSITRKASKWEFNKLDNLKFNDGSRW
jgi:hypothetical protein